jgi:hypothetical protein
MSYERKCPNCGIDMERLIDVIKPERQHDHPGLSADGASVTGSRSARYECAGCHHIQLYFEMRGTWTICTNVAHG